MMLVSTYQLCTIPCARQYAKIGRNSPPTRKSLSTVWVVSTVFGVGGGQDDEIFLMITVRVCFWHLGDVKARYAAH